MNSTDLEKLSRLLENQLNLQNSLLAIEKRKTDVLVEGNIEKLDGILKEEQFLLLNCAGLKNQRETFLKECGLCGRSLHKIAEEFDREGQYRLKSRLENLSDVLGRLKKTNGTNKRILDSRLFVLNRCMTLLGMEQQAVVYDRDGHIE
ncbi:hypothetical protein SDC9_172907 [bioreactor metagenome]|uniref:FlgN protein n=1 Tax=bioreactor metagenome TaxID=1076179 RepID=A0A645GH43_9ZZZZ